jgi:hypothetical protein
MAWQPGHVKSMTAAYILIWGVNCKPGVWLSAHKTNASLRFDAPEALREWTGLERSAAIPHQFLIGWWDFGLKRLFGRVLDSAALDVLFF